MIAVEITVHGDKLKNNFRIKLRDGEVVLAMQLQPECLSGKGCGDDASQYVNVPLTPQMIEDIKVAMEMAQRVEAV